MTATITTSHDLQWAVQTGRMSSSDRIGAEQREEDYDAYGAIVRRCAEAGYPLRNSGDDQPILIPRTAPKPPHRPGGGA